MIEPYVTPEYVQSLIEKADYYVFPGTTLTVCCLTLKNGFTVTGESACVVKENFDTDTGRAIAYQKARDKIWNLAGYLFQEQLFNSSRT